MLAAMSTRRVRQVDYDDDDRWDETGASWQDSSWQESSWYGDEWGEGYSKPAAKSTAAGKAAAKPKAGQAKASASKAGGAAAPAKAKAAAGAAAPKAKAAAAGADAPTPAEAAAAKAKAKAGGASSSSAKPKEAAAPKERFEPPAREAKAAESKSTAEAPSPDEDAEAATAAAAAAVPEPDDARPSLSLVVIGHVDAGKSTLMGHLLCKVGNVSTKQLHKFEKESKQIGKASFAFAWVLDEGEDERQRGVTIDVCVKHFETSARRFTILDAPGHRDFVPNMLQGAVQADVALLVADVSHFEAGFERGGQTKEHLQLVRFLGISHIVVAVNKLDTCDWSQKVFENIQNELQTFITGPDCGFKAKDVTYVPMSGFTGENMLERTVEGLKWWTGPTLIEALDQLPLPARAPASRPLRLAVADLYKSTMPGLSGTCLSGKVEAGTISVGQKVQIMPSGEITTVKNLQTRDKLARAGQSGDYMDAVMVPVEPHYASIGSVLCDPKDPVPLVDAFQVQLMVFDVEIPLMRGQQMMCYLHTETLTATLARLESLLVKGKPSDKRPKCLQKGQIGIVQLKVNRKVCVEPKPADGSPNTSLGRLVLRDRGHTVAAGMVLSVLPPS